LGHSYGTLQLLYSLNHFITQTEKDTMIAAYVAAAPPYLGAPSAMRNEMGGNPEIIKKVFGHEYVGLQFRSQMELLTSNPSNFDLYPKDTFFRFADAPWMKQIQERIKYENDPKAYKAEKGESQIPFSFLPESEEGVAYCG
jgi:hypothetical protein